MSNMPPNMPPGGAERRRTIPRRSGALSRTAKGRVARATRCLARTAARMEGELCGHVRPARAFDGRSHHSGRVGVIALLVVSGHLDAGTFWSWYGQWWPLLLIGAGLALLGEWALDMRRKTPVRRSGGFIGILIFLAFLGAVSAAHNHFWGPFHGDFGDDSFFNTFGMPEHDSDQPVDNRQIPANASIEIRVPRGDVSITASDQPNLEVRAQEVAYANSDSGGRKSSTPRLRM